jgi:mannose-6-phosphate isomerase-like protein (cupin superfamily)
MALIWRGNIEERTLSNETFRTVLHVGEHSELTLMSIPPGEEIGLEVHAEIDQFLRIESGQAKVVAGPDKENLNETYELSDDWAFVVPAGTWHNVINTGDKPLKLYTLYSPPNHEAGTVHKTKEEAEAAEAAEHAA